MELKNSRSFCSEAPDSLIARLDSPHRDASTLWTNSRSSLRNSDVSPFHVPRSSFKRSTRSTAAPFLSPDPFVLFLVVFENSDVHSVATRTPSDHRNGTSPGNCYVPRKIAPNLRNFASKSGSIRFPSALSLAGIREIEVGRIWRRSN